MRTKNSVDAAHVDDPCWATDITCPVKHRPAVCSAYDCGFYKPAGCKDFIRIEDKDGINFVPPEEYYEKATAQFRETFEAAAKSLPGWTVDADKWEYRPCSAEIKTREEAFASFDKRRKKGKKTWRF